jgi:hypothetical protein
MSRWLWRVVNGELWQVVDRRVWRIERGKGRLGVIVYWIHVSL